MKRKPEGERLWTKDNADKIQIPKEAGGEAREIKISRNEVNIMCIVDVVYKHNKIVINILNL